MSRRRSFTVGALIAVGAFVVLADGVSQASELTSAASAGLVAIETRHRESRRVDEHGNEYRLRGISWWQRRGRLDPRLFYDVWFVPRQ